MNQPLSQFTTRDHEQLTDHYHDSLLSFHDWSNAMGLGYKDATRMLDGRATTSSTMMGRAIQLLQDIELAKAMIEAEGGDYQKETYAYLVRKAAFQKLANNA